MNEEWLKSDSFRRDIVCANLRVGKVSKFLFERGKIGRESIKEKI